MLRNVSSIAKLVSATVLTLVLYTLNLWHILYLDKRQEIASDKKIG